MAIKYFLKLLIVALLFNVMACKKSTESKAEKKAPISVTAVKVAENDIKEYLTF